MDNFGFQSVKLIGWDHNWDGAGSYAIDLMDAAGDAFDGVAFHCYAVGDPFVSDVWSSQAWLRETLLNRIRSTPNILTKR